MSYGFTLDGTHYDVVRLRDMQVIDQIRLERWLAGNGDVTDARSFEDVLGIEDEVATVEAARSLAAREEPEKAARIRSHPETNLIMAVAVWAARRAAGEKVPLDDLGRFSYDDLDWDDEEPEPEGKAEAAPDLLPDRGGSDAP